MFGWNRQKDYTERYIFLAKWKTRGSEIHVIYVTSKNTQWKKNLFE